MCSIPKMCGVLDLQSRPLTMHSPTFGASSNRITEYPSRALSTMGDSMPKGKAQHRLHCDTANLKEIKFMCDDEVEHVRIY